MTKFIELNFESKNQKALIKLESFLKKGLKSIKLDAGLSKTKKKYTKQRFSILKSPHINKKAQEQFQYTKRLLKLYKTTPSIFKLLKFIKEVNINVLSTIRLKVNVEYNIKPQLYSKQSPKIRFAKEKKKILKTKCVRKILFRLTQARLT